MANKLTTFAQARQQAQSSKEYTDAMVAEVAEAAAESIQEVAEQLPTSISIILAAANWSSKKQTITVAGVTATNTVIVAPEYASQNAYTSAGVYCTAQAANSLTFTCATVPTVALTVNVVILGG